MVLLAISALVMYRSGRIIIIEKFLKCDYSLPFPVDFACIFWSINLVKYNFIFNNFATFNSETDNVLTNFVSATQKCVHS